MTKKERERLRQEAQTELEACMERLWKLKQQKRRLDNRYLLCEQQAVGLMERLGTTKFQRGAAVIERTKGTTRTVLDQNKVKAEFTAVYGCCLTTQEVKPQYQYYEEKVNIEEQKKRTVCKKTGRPYPSLSEPTK